MLQIGFLECYQKPSRIPLLRPGEECEIKYVYISHRIWGGECVKSIA